MKEFKDQKVEAVFFDYPEKIYHSLIEIREMIFEISEKDRQIGELTETLRWGQPSYLTKETKSGSLVRIDKFGKDEIAIFFHCGTTLVESFKLKHGDTFKYSKNRAIVLTPGVKLAKMPLLDCIESALAYHLRKN